MVMAHQAPDLNILRTNGWVFPAENMCPWNMMIWGWAHCVPQIIGYLIEPTKKTSEYIFHGSIHRRADHFDIFWSIPASKVALKSCEIDGRLSFCCKDCCISADGYCLDMATGY